MAKKAVPSEALSFWQIKVSGYGTFTYFGSEYDAESMRRHKASWEGGSGSKKRIGDVFTEDQARAIELWAGNERDARRRAPSTFNDAEGRESEEQ